MVEVPDDVARDYAAKIRSIRTPDDFLYVDVGGLADILDPPKPPPTLVAQMLDAFYGSHVLRMHGADECMAAALAVVRAEIQANWENWDGLIRLDRVLDLLGGDK